MRIPDISQVNAQAIACLTGRTCSWGWCQPIRGRRVLVQSQIRTSVIINDCFRIHSAQTIHECTVCSYRRQPAQRSRFRAGTPQGSTVHSTAFFAVSSMETVPPNSRPLALRGSDHTCRCAYFMHIIATEESHAHQWLKPE